MQEFFSGQGGLVANYSRSVQSARLHTSSLVLKPTRGSGYFSSLGWRRMSPCLFRTGTTSDLENYSPTRNFRSWKLMMVIWLWLTEKVVSMVSVCMFGVCARAWILRFSVSSPCQDLIVYSRRV